MKSLIFFFSRNEISDISNHCIDLIKVTNFLEPIHKHENIGKYKINKIAIK